MVGPLFHQGTISGFLEKEGREPAIDLPGGPGDLEPGVGEREQGRGAAHPKDSGVRLK